ncbi:RNA-binding protein 8A [Seminavis robusta]|uniref:RNA-binding protein 8A n=1 Tax=Seminavis robusta TaxID=568900 RepID=A0A9N8HU64_9STRA|nr:RNA-binding protein 8A [Seminavis robusta]|eukprot:Sro1610_g285830.1 RNA-binding protein 8A (128) ;mRNA; r:18975-19358
MQRSPRDDNPDNDHEAGEIRSRHPHHQQRTIPRTGAVRSVEGWVVFVTGIHEEAQEDDISDAFSDHGTVTKMQMNVDRQTGLAKGYALVEYASQTEAQDAINNLHGAKILGKTIAVNWAFVKPTGYR